MPNIRYICLSDLHLGEEDSVLTGSADSSRPSPVLTCLAECLAALVRQNEPGAPKPDLILAGDLLELALSPADQALATFEHFLRRMMPANDEIFGEIVYLPGNHDHHMWQAARETQYTNYLGRLEPGAPVKPPWDTTKVVMDFAGKDHLASGAATAIARRLPHLRERGFEVFTAYPNYAIRDGDRAVVFHHGHFIEPAYRFFSTLGSLFFPSQSLPEDIYTLEKENGGWIDFFWSTLGSSGRIGEDMESVYEASADERSLHRLTDTFAHSLAARFAVPGWAPRFLREWALRAACQEAARGLTTGLERRQSAGEAPLTGDAVEGLRWYAGPLLRRQFEDEMCSAPGTVTFVLGHTHKPFVDSLDGTRVLNTGGWVVDSPKLQPLHGAAAVLVSEDLSAVNVRCYNEGAYEVRAEEPLPPGAAHSAFYERITGLLHNEPRPWKWLGETAREEVRARAAALAQRVRQRSAAAH